MIIKILTKRFYFDLMADSSKRVPLSSTRPLSSTQKGHSFSAPKTPQFHTALSTTHPSVHWGVLVRNWGVFGAELRNFGCWKGVFLVLKWCVELRGTYQKKKFLNKKIGCFRHILWKDLRHVLGIDPDLSGFDIFVSLPQLLIFLNFSLNENSWDFPRAFPGQEMEPAEAQISQICYATIRTKLENWFLFLQK